MLAANVTEGQLNLAASLVKVRIIAFQHVSKTRIRFRLAPADHDTFRAISNSGRRKHAVCWHGHRDFFRVLFRDVPEAKVQTTFLTRGNRFNVDAEGPAERWYTAENFERVFPGTGDVNVGSMFNPLRMSDACRCDE